MKRFNISVNGTSYDVVVDEVSGAAPVAAPVSAPVPAAAPAPVAVPAPAPAVAPAPAPKAEVPADGIKVFCPMPGTIMNMFVAVGDAVKKGDNLLTFEAMKMENEILAPQDATVTGIFVKKGDSVETNQLLVTLA